MRHSWVALENWGFAVGTNRVQPSSPHAVHSFEMQTQQGTIGVTVGSRLATWNGSVCWLGFAPQLIEGKPFIHLLDAQKNILPLLSQPEPWWRINPVLVIDPGHGGKSVGTQDIINGRYEKEFTLDWALRIRQLLAGKGWRVQLTRTNDTDVSIADRVKFADQCQASLFISLHFNSGLTNHNVSGLETYCLTPTGMPSSITRDEYPDQESAVFPNNDFDEQNFSCAICLHRSLVRATGHTDGGVRRARFLGVLRNQRRPAILIEGGYLSNPTEARLIADGSYRQKLAEAVVKALLQD